METSSTPASPLPVPIPETDKQPPLPSPPFIITIPGIFNLRTLSSIRIPSHQPPAHISGHIFRSGDPSLIPTPHQSNLHTTLGITTIFDLRSRGERNLTCLPSIQGIDNRHTPIYENRDANPAEIAKTVAKYGDAEGVEGFVGSYVNMLNVGTNALRAWFRFLMENDAREGVLVHCTAGKDRTGVAVALVLMLAGVQEGVIADEYALTDLGLVGWREGAVKVLLGTPGLEGDEVKIRRMLSARREVMVAFLEVLKRDYGGAEGYLVQRLGFTHEEVQRIRRNVIEED